MEKKNQPVQSKTMQSLTLAAKKKAPVVQCCAKVSAIVAGCHD